MEKKRVLFICVHNSGRSQMAEAFLKEVAGEDFQVESAGLEPTTVNPLVAEVMKEIGIDLSRKSTQSVFDLFKKGCLFDYVITVCDDASEEKCPVFPGISQRLHWPFPDPEALAGSKEEKLAQLRMIRDDIKKKIEEWRQSDI
ncbi:MAG: arsenate reductase ArsC [Desulfococcaceae bacterium]|jgi:arsenate reductase|nr:arsenate reductase ArsC [Desulfococcaceae bacterium]